VGGAAVGLVPSDVPSDIYSEVAKAANMLMQADADEGIELGQKWAGKMTRKLSKPNTMTTPYGATKRGMCGQIEGVFQKMKADGVEVTADLKDCQYLANTNYQAIGKVVVAAHQAMDWLKEAARVAASNALPVSWTTPSGLLVLQSYREQIGKSLDFDVAGKRIRLMLKNEGDKLDGRKQSAGISPNFIHSLDAAHMMRTVAYCLDAGITDFAMIHDSYGSHAGAAEDLRNLLRRAFVDQYSEEVLADFKQQLANQLPAELAKELPELPPCGTLDLEGVMHSEYFFA
jgi:DNA-directed RNA polymerase